MSLPPLPTFIVVGAQKSGTRWLRHNLGLHPQVFTVARELEFFNHNFDRGSAWYRARFEGWAGEPHRGEATPGYMFLNERPYLQAGRIDGLLPAAKVFAVLRNPVDRTYSAYVHHQVRDRIPHDRSLLQHLEDVEDREDPLGLVTGSWYAASLRPYVERFGGRIQVLLQEDVRERPEATYHAATAHLGLDDGFVPRELARVRFSNTVPTDSVARQGSARRTLTPGERVAVADRCLADVADLRRLLPDLDLSAWDDDFPSRQGDVATPTGAEAASATS